MTESPTPDPTALAGAAATEAAAKVAAAAAAKAASDAAAKVVADKATADAAAAAAATAAGTGGTTDDASKDWEARFKGLQPLHQKLQDEKKAWEDSRLKLGGQVAELDTALKAAQAQIVKLQEDGTKATSGQTELQKTVDGLQKQLERNALIMSDYPQLSVLEAKGLLPKDVEGDALKGALDSMLSVLTTEGQRLAGLKGAGSTGDGTHTTGARSQGDDLSTISDQLLEANQKGNAAEIKRLTGLLIDARNKQLAGEGVKTG